MPWKCPICGHENPDDTDVCEACGYVRGSEQAPALAEPRQGEESGEGPETTGEEPSGGEAVAAEAGAVEPTGEQAGAPAEAGGEEASPETSGQWYLEVVDSPARELIGKKIPLLFNVFPRISVGKSPENVVIIPDATVSRRHAVIERRPDGRIVIRDLGSTNGTFVYRQEEAVFEKVEEAELRPGMLLRLGATTLRVVVE